MILRAIREMISSFREGKMRTIMAVTTVSIAMLIFGGFLLLTHNLRVGIDAFRSATRLEVILSDEADAVKVTGTILGMEGVAATRHYTRDEALQWFRQRQGAEKASGITDAIGSNPFPAFVEVTFATGVIDPRPIANKVRDIPGVVDVLFGEETADRLDRMARMIATATWAIGAIMAVFIFLIAVNGIRATVHARRDEIRVLRLIGASDFFIKAPFLCEGALVGLLGAGIGLGLLFVVFHFAQTEIPWFDPEFIPVEALAAAALFSWALGIFGGLIAVRESLAENE